MMHLPSPPSEATTHPSMTMTMPMPMPTPMPKARAARAARTVPRATVMTMMTMVTVVTVVAMSHHGLGRGHLPAPISMGTATSEAKAHLAKG